MSVGRAGSDLHVARVFGGDKAEFDEMVESAAVVRPLARVRPDAEPADAVGGGVDPAAADVAGRGHASGHGHCNVSAVAGPVARPAAPEAPPSVAGVMVPGSEAAAGVETCVCETDVFAILGTAESILDSGRRFGDSTASANDSCSCMAAKRYILLSAIGPRPCD